MLSRAIALVASVCAALPFQPEPTHLATTELRMTQRLLVATVWMLAVSENSAPLQAGDWPQLLGPARDGVVPAAPSPTSLAQPEVLWERALGSGFAGPAVADGRLVIAHREGDEMRVDAVDAATGALLWRFSRPTNYADSFGFDDGPRGVPAIAHGRVWVHGADGVLDALDFVTGAALWSVDTQTLFGSPQGYFGRACSPLVLEGRVILTPGGTMDGKAAGVAAFAVEDGRTLWHSVEDEAGYASPVALPDGHLLCWMRNRLWLLEADNGAVVASRPLRSRMDASVNAAQPLLLDGGRVLLSAGYGVGLHVLKLPSLELDHQQENLLDCHYSSPVRGQGGLVFGFDGRQETGQTLRCVDLDTGEIRWQSERVPGGTLIRAGGCLLAVTEQGELWVVEASAPRFHVLHRVQILRAGHRAHPAFADGVLFARDGRQLVAVRVFD